jgi:hypothetical protein
MAIRFYCQQCHKPLEVDDTDAGKQVLCFYCQTKVAVPVETDPTLAAARPDTAITKKSTTLGQIGLMASLAAIAVVIVLFVWAFGRIAPVSKTPSFASLPKEQQKELINKEVVKLKKEKTVIYGSVIFFIFALAGVGFSIVGILRNSGRGSAIVGLLIGGFFVMLQLLNILRAMRTTPG